ncbi:MAG TPA: potassium-transporting ATPase subunit C [Thermoplasmata archaeon]|nr:potassium-transporting ATPase subunit C [Thermoplasmata archaeon]
MKASAAQSTPPARQTVGAPSSPVPPPGGLAPDPPFRLPSWRSALGLLAITVLLGGLAYPAAVTGFAQALVPGPANGSLVYASNGTAIGSELIGQNITNASLFWLRPSFHDFSATLGSGQSPYGPTDPNLVNLTKYYIAQYGLNGTAVPLVLIAPSESGLDPDLTPEAALVQIPRVAFHTGLSPAFLVGFVENHVQAPLLGFLGPSYVDVIQLDLDLLSLLGK